MLVTNHFNFNDHVFGWRAWSYDCFWHEPYFINMHRPQQVPVNSNLQFVLSLVQASGVWTLTSEFRNSFIMALSGRTVNNGNWDGTSVFGDGADWCWTTSVVAPLHSHPAATFVTLNAHKEKWLNLKQRRQQNNHSRRCARHGASMQHAVRIIWRCTSGYDAASPRGPVLNAQLLRRCSREAWTSFRSNSNV